MTRKFACKLQDTLKEVLGEATTTHDSETATTAKQIMSINDDICYIWSSQENCVLALRLDESESKCTKLIPTNTPLFEVEKLNVSPTGRWICVWGGRGVTALEIPRRSGKNRTFVGTESDGSVVVHCVPIAERFFMCNLRIVLQQASWHPGSEYDSHLMTLTSDNTLRIFNMDVEVDGTPAEETLLLSKGQNGDITERRFFGQSALTVKGSLGETAVAFSFAPPVNDSTEDPNPNLWPIFILCGDGSVYFVISGLNQAGLSIRPQVMGPLPMLPEAEDNYGSEACAILCLHPMISSPPLLVIGRTDGTLYHCVVLQKTDDDINDEALETASQISEWSTSIFNNEVSVELVLHVYECVELELSLVNAKGQTESQRPFDYPLHLSVDPMSPSRYFCSHKAGVHSVNLPMVGQLAELVKAPEETFKGMSLEQPSLVQHLICTQLFSKSNPSPVQGLTVSYPPAQLHCILSDFKAISIPLSKTNLMNDPQPLLCEDTSLASAQTASSNKESFDKYIATILQRTTNNPVMKAPKSANMSAEESYEILARSTKVLRDEYIGKLDKARKEIEKRVAGLETRKAQQHLSLSKLTEERFSLRDKAAQLSEKYEDIRDNQENQVSRIETILNVIQRRLPVASDAEIRMQRQLQSIERKVKDLANALEQIKAKEKYQMRQIQHTQENTKARHDDPNGGHQMGANQIESMRDVLRQDGEQISSIMKRLNNLKKDVMV